MHRHPAKKLLELDIVMGKANGTKPAELEKTRSECKDFGMIQWCKAVNKEKSKQVEDKFWIENCNQEGTRHHAEQRTTQQKEAGMAIRKNKLEISDVITLLQNLKWSIKDYLMVV